MNRPGGCARYFLRCVRDTILGIGAALMVEHYLSCGIALIVVSNVLDTWIEGEIFGKTKAPQHKVKA